MARTTSLTRAAALDRASLWILLIVSSLVGLAILATTLIDAISTGASGSTTLFVSVDSPMPEELYPAGLALESARFTEGVITTSALSWGPTTTLVLGKLLNGFSLFVVALAVVHLGWSQLKGNPFRGSVIFSTITASVALIAGTSFAGFLTGIGTTVAMSELVGGQFMTENYPLIVSFDFAPFFIGIAIGIVAAAFEYGNRLRADTEGLV